MAPVLDRHIHANNRFCLIKSKARCTKKANATPACAIVANEFKEDAGKSLLHSTHYARNKIWHAPCFTALAQSRLPACDHSRLTQNKKGKTMNEQARIELIRLLARFKLQVRRQLDQTVDLYQLEHDTTYARSRLAAIEDLADDEELLVMVLRLRELLLPEAAPVIQQPPAPAASARYMYGARS